MKKSDIILAKKTILAHQVKMESQVSALLLKIDIFMYFSFVIFWWFYLVKNSKSRRNCIIVVPLQHQIVCPVVHWVICERPVAEEVTTSLRARHLCCYLPMIAVQTPDLLLQDLQLPLLPSKPVPMYWIRRFLPPKGSIARPQRQQVNTRMGLVCIWPMN